ncbi:MAG: hypothetical protein WBD28_12480 [Candidatus Zixiibacteriota bacterium]
MKFKVILCLALLILISLGGLSDLSAKTSAGHSSKLRKWGHTWEEAAKKPIPVIATYPSWFEFFYIMTRLVPIAQIKVFKLQVTFGESTQNKSGTHKSYEGREKCGSKQKSQEQSSRKGLPASRP